MRHFHRVLIWLSCPLLVAAQPTTTRAEAKRQINRSAVVYAQGFGFSFEGSAEYFLSNHHAKQEPKLTAKENGDQLPFGIGPKHPKFIVSLKAPKFIKNQKEWRERETWVQFVPLQDPTETNFATAYPELENTAKGLRSMLNSGRVTSVACEHLLVWEFLDAMQMIHAKARILKTPWCNGIQYITQEVQEACEIDNNRMLYRFIGLSLDGKFLVDIGIPIAHPSLPIPAPGIESAEQAKALDYCTKAEIEINRWDDKSFFPSLPSFEALVNSIRLKP